MPCYAQDLVNTALSQVGYHEKKSNSSLDSFTANSGSGNYTKYAQEIYSKYPSFYNGNKNGYAWCDLFYDWCMITTFGITKALELLCQPQKSAGAGCPYSYGYYKAKGQVGKTPKLGAQIFFGYSEANLYHTGMVVAYDSTYVTTVEGNSNDAVSKNRYKRTDATIFGYGYPKFDGNETSTSGNTANSTPATTQTTTNTSNNTTSGLSRTVQWTGIANTTVTPRSWAGDTYSALKTVGNIAKGDSVGVCGTVQDSKKNNWYYVFIANKAYGFVPASTIDSPSAILEAHDPSKALNKTVKCNGTVNATSLNVRTWAGTKYSRLTSVPSINFGTTVEIMDAIYDDSKEVWYYVRINGKTYGFVHSDYITISSGNGTVTATKTTKTTTTQSTSSSDVPLTSASRKTT